MEVADYYKRMSGGLRLRLKKWSVSLFVEKCMILRLDDLLREV